MVGGERKLWKKTWRQWFWTKMSQIQTLQMTRMDFQPNSHTLTEPFIFSEGDP